MYPDDFEEAKSLLLATQIVPLQTRASMQTAFRSFFVTSIAGGWHHYSVPTGEKLTYRVIVKASKLVSKELSSIVEDPTVSSCVLFRLMKNCLIILILAIGCI